MDGLKNINTLFEYAQRRQTPIFHVSDQVLAEIVNRESIRLTPLSFVAGISAAAAAIAFFYAIHGWLSVTGSVADYFDPSVLDILL